MTLIASFTSAASAAVDRLSGRGASGRDADGGQFATVLATMNSGAARTAIGRAREVRGADDADAARISALEEEEAAADRAEEAARADEAAASEAAAAKAAIEEAATPVPSADVRSVNRSLDSLVPELRSRLDRVMSRMEAEFGHSVTVVEAQRSQERQNFLYEQGRSRPGNVVTWTRNSNHLGGRAVDVMIDGTYNNALGYQRLAKIAAEEGLRTLGAKDPGHVELPKGVDGGGPAPKPGAGSSVFAALPTEALHGADPAGVARVAEVARVADLASVARVADVARIADPAGLAMNVTSGGAASAAAALAARGAVQSQSGSAGSGSSGGGSGGHQGADSQMASAVESELLRGDPSLGRVFALNSSFDGAGGITGTDAVQRAAQILALKEGASAAPVNHLLLRLDNAAGGEDRIRVDLRGGTVGTTLSIGNSGDAERLAARVGELRQSLERHGLETEAVRIRTTPASTDRVDLSRAVLAAADAESARSGSGRSNADSSQREGWKEAPDQQLRRETGDPRQRSRKEQPNEKNA